MNEFLLILNLALNACMVDYSATDKRANPPALIKRCVQTKTRCYSRLPEKKTQKAILACLEL